MNEKHNIGESTLIKINNLDEMNQFAIFLVEQLKSGDLILLNRSANHRNKRSAIVEGFLV